MAWMRPQYSRGQVDRAGQYLLAGSLDGLDEALSVVNNWRSSHSYPLQVLRKTLLNRAQGIDRLSIVAQRLKRMSSIEIKLRRNPDMALSRMQDIGGCRAVLRSVDRVDRLVSLYEESDAKRTGLRAEFVRKFDYIAAPKEDGYRSVHLIYKYRSASKGHEVWNGHRIEIQIRSRLQHAWATAVETVDTFTSQSIKTGGGTEQWRRFFVLMGTALARSERRPVGPGCPEDPEVLRLELSNLAEELRVQAVLSGWLRALQFLPPKQTSDTGVYLLYLDTDRDQLSVTGFADHERASASEAYLKTEKAIKDKSSAQAVLVSAESVQALRTAFPNYFADTTVFLEELRKALSRT